MGGIERKLFAAVLETEAQSGHDDAGAHAAIVALDERHHVAVGVGGAEVDGVVGRRRAGFDATGGVLEVDQRATLGGVRF